MIKINQISRMPPTDNKSKSKKKVYPTKVLRRAGKGGKDDDSTVDSEGNIRDLIDYNYTSDESSESYVSIPKRTPRKAAIVARKKIRKAIEKEVEKKRKIKEEPETSKKNKVFHKSKEIKRLTPSKRRYPFKESTTKPDTKRKRRPVDDTDEDESSFDESEEESEEEEEEESEEEESEEEESEEESEEEEEISDEEDDKDDDDDEEEDDDEEINNKGFGGIILTLGGAPSANNSMTPKKYNMKKEPESVKQFVKLLTTPIEENTIDAQIGQFKELADDKQKELITALENRPTTSDSGINLMLKILTLKLPSDVQAMILAKYNSLQSLDTSSNEYFKLRAWLDKVVSIPFGICKDIPVRLEDGTDKCADFMRGSKKCLDDAVYGQDESKLQIMQFISTKIANPQGRGLCLLLAGPPGIGKCHAKDTPILMADGTIKLVQDIIVGDNIMGDDSRSRQVLSLGRGQDIMYDIIPTKGDTYKVNSEHIMCLKQSGKGIIKPINSKIISYKTIRINNKEKCLSYKTFKTYENAEDYLNSFSEEDNILEISVKDYLELPKEIKNGWLKGYRKGVNFPYIEPEFDPYIVGLWLGDGTSSNTGITSQDAEIITYLQKTLPQYNLMLSYYSKYDYRIRAITNGKTDNIFLQVLKKYNMINNKHIPLHFKCNSRDARLKLLAGLVDTDGYVNYNTIEIAQKSKQMTDDILYLARSLGFAAYSREKKTTWTYKDIKKYGLCNIITISGDIADIPIRIKRKIPEVRQQKKDVLVTGIKVKEAGYGDYYGFTLDGNHRYLMGDFTVTHNTSLIKNGIAKALNWPFQFISLGGDSDASTYTGHQLVYESSHCGKIVNSLIASKSMSTVLMFDEVDKISQTPKGEEVMNLLIHLTDPVQNEDFEDKYLSGVPIDLSKVMFVFSANDINKIDKVLLDRMMVIDLKGYDLKQKTIIAEQYLLPLALKDVNLNERIAISKDILTNVIQEYANEEKGVRELKRCIEQITQKINMLRMYNSPDLPFYIKDFSLPFIVKKDHVKLFIKKKENTNGPPPGMYC